MRRGLREPFIEYVPFDRVKIDSLEVRQRDIDDQTKILEKEGQIVPLLAHPHADGTWTVSDRWDYPYACARVEAMWRMGYETVMLTNSNEET